MITTPSELKDYCVVCNEVARRNDLSARAKGVYYYLATLPKDWQLSQQELLQHFTEGRQAVNTAFKELINAGYVEQKRVHDEKGMIKGYKYKVHWSCQKPVNQKTVNGSPVNGSPEIGQPATTNYLYKLNTDRVITKELNTEIKPKGFNRYAFIESFFLENFKEYPKNVESSIREHMQVRDRQRCSKTERAIKSYLNTLVKLSGGQFLQMVKILDQSSDNGWKGLFKLKEEFRQGRQVNESSYSNDDEETFL